MNDYFIYFCFWVCASFVFGSIVGTVTSNKGESRINLMEQKVNYLIGNDLKNLERLKNDCESKLDSNKECVMIYDFVPVKRDEK